MDNTEHMEKFLEALEPLRKHIGTSNDEVLGLFESIGDLHLERCDTGTVEHDQATLAEGEAELLVSLRKFGKPKIFDIIIKGICKSDPLLYKCYNTLLQEEGKTPRKLINLRGAIQASNTDTKVDKEVNNNNNAKHKISNGNEQESKKEGTTTTTTVTSTTTSKAAQEDDADDDVVEVTTLPKIPRVASSGEIFGVPPHNLGMYEATKNKSGSAWPVLTAIAALKSRRPHAMVAVNDAQFSQRDTISVSISEAIAANKESPIPSHLVNKGGIGVTKGPKDGLEYMVVESRRVLLTDNTTFRIREGWTNVEAGWINNILACRNSPLYIAVTTEANSQGRLPGQRFIYTIKGARHYIENGKVALHRESNAVWWVESRGSIILAVGYDGSILGEVPRDTAHKAGRPLYMDVSIEDLAVENKSEEGSDQESDDEDPYKIGQNDSKRVQADELRRQVDLDLIWSFEDDDGNVEMADPVEIDWPGDPLTIEKLALVAAKALGKNVQRMAKDEYAVLIRKAFEVCGNIVFKDKVKESKPLPGSSRTTRKGSKRNAEKMEKMDEKEVSKTSEMTTRPKRARGDAVKKS